MKNNFYFSILHLALGFSLIACDKNPKFDFSKVPRTQSFSSEDSEGPAVNTCLMRSVDALAVDNDINEKLNSEKTTTLNLVLSGKRLNSLPTSSNTALTRYSKYLFGSQPIDINNCNDLTCILERVHNSKTREAALFAHSFYLNTGYWLSQTRQMPHLATEGNSDESHQFTLKELKAFYQLGLNLPDGMKRLRTLQTLHRLQPRSYIPKYGESSCGLAWSDGSILLMDNCLTLSQQDPARGDFFFEAVTHEIGHHFGYSSADKIDESEQWLAFSGWKMTDFVKPDGTIKREWKSDPTKEGFARDYGGTSPVEDWADGVAYALMDADDFKSKAPKKVQFINQKVFGNRSYDKTSLIDYYATSLAFETLANPKLNELVKQCMSLTDNDLRTFDSSEDEFAALFEPDSEKYGKCISTKLKDLYEKLDQKLESQEFFYCDLKQSPSVKFYSYVTSSLANRVVELVKQNNPLAPWLPKLKVLSESFDRSIYPPEIAYQCLEKSPQTQTECYNTLIQEKVTALAQEQQFEQPELLAQFQKEVSKRYPYDEAKNSLKNIYLSFLTGLNGNLTNLGQKLWSECYNSNTEIQGELKFSPYTGASLFVPPEILQCLNTRLDNVFKQATKSVAGRVGLDFKSDGAWNLLNELFWKNLIDPIDAALAEGHQREAATTKLAFDKINSEFKLQVNGFQTSLQNPRDFSTKCLEWRSAFQLPNQAEFRFLNIAALAQEKIVDCSSFQNQIISYQSNYLAKSEKAEIEFYKKIIEQNREQFFPAECKDLKSGLNSCIKRKTNWAAYRSECRRQWLVNLPNPNIGTRWENKLTAAFKAVTGF